jgi:hypothetical protein
MILIEVLAPYSKTSMARSKLHSSHRWIRTKLFIFRKTELYVVLNAGKIDSNHILAINLDARRGTERNHSQGHAVRKHSRARARKQQGQATLARIFWSETTFYRLEQH